MSEQDLSQLRRDISKIVDPQIRKYVASLGDEDLVHLLTETYSTHFKLEGVNTSYGDKVFLAIWEYLQKEVEDGLGIALSKNPSMGSNKAVLLEVKVHCWKVGRDEFYEEKIDELTLQFGVDLRAARGYSTVKALFTRKIESYQRQLEDQKAPPSGDATSPKTGSPSQKSAAPKDPTENRISLLADKLREKMAHHNLSKKEVAAFIGKHRGTLDDFFNGRASATTLAQVERLIAHYEPKSGDST